MLWQAMSPLAPWEIVGSDELGKLPLLLLGRKAASGAFGCL